jgi:hypothetical protein
LLFRKEWNERELEEERRKEDGKEEDNWKRRRGMKRL